MTFFALLYSKARLNTSIMQKVFWFFIPVCLFSVLHAQNPTVGLIQSTSQAQDGYTLFSPSSGNVTYLIDNCGREIHSWQSDYRPAQSAYLLNNGDLLRTAKIPSGFTGGGSGGRVERISWDGELVWSYNFSTDSTHQHHDIEPLPNGHFLVILWDKKNLQQVSQAGRILPQTEIWSEKIQEIQPIGTDSIQVVWEWSLWDHLIQDQFPDASNYGDVFEHPELMDINFGIGEPNSITDEKDWVHFNSVDYDQELDWIVLSSRHLNEIWIIDHSTTTAEAASHSGGNSGRGGDILWRWGNPRVYDRGAINNQRFFGQHDARFIPASFTEERQIIVFNNGIGRPGGNNSSVDILQLPLNDNNQIDIPFSTPHFPSDLDWTFQPAALFAPRISGAQPLENGNILICEGTNGRFIEIDSQGVIVWEYINPLSLGNPVPQGTDIFSNDVFRATRLLPDAPAFAEKDLTPGAPLELNPLPNDCEMISKTIERPTLEVKLLNSVFNQSLQLSQNENRLRYDIRDINGRLIFRKENRQERLEINTTAWISGMYFIQVYGLDEQNFILFKAIKP